MQIISYTSVTDIRIKFIDEYGYEMNSNMGNFKKGQVRNPYDKTICGVGYNGVGKYLTNTTPFDYMMWTAWRKMLLRCYDENYRSTYPAYVGCTVCDEWHCYQNFAQWYEENYYEVIGHRMHIDKDILVKDNKIYSPETCLIVPQRINMIFMSKTNKWDFPSGISLSKTGKYITSYNTKHLGSLDTLEDAILAHDTEKRIHIKNVAEEYKTLIKPKVYDAMLAW